MDWNGMRQLAGLYVFTYIDPTCGYKRKNYRKR